MGGHLLLYTKSSRSSLIKPLTAYLLKPIKRYTKASTGHEIDQERATSTAEEFKRVAEEKLRLAQQGVASQTIEKAFDAVEEATIGEGTVKSVKNRYKQHKKNANYHKNPED